MSIKPHTDLEEVELALDRTLKRLGAGYEQPLKTALATFRSELHRVNVERSHAVPPPESR